MLRSVGVKISHRNFSKKADSDLNKNVGGSTDLLKKWNELADLDTPIRPTLQLSLFLSTNVQVT